APYESGGHDLPAVLDMEWDTTNFPTEECYGLSQSAMQTWIESFLAAAKAQTSLTPVIYTSQSWWNTCVGTATTEFSADPVWVADYGVTAPALPHGWSNYTFWQTSNVGTINGIGNGDADLDQFQSVPSVLTSASGTSGSVQLQTLNSLAGQPVMYSATGLGTGLSLNSSGDISWTSATPVGSYPITVTPTVTSPSGSTGGSGSGAVVPSTIPFTLHVHGAITIASSSHSTSAGTPVLYQVSSSGPDQSAGFAPSFTASGLPAGLSMNSSGLITGWASKPGTYTVKVSATDGIGGSGSASFTWAIGAAANSGTTGTIKQIGGSGKCLNDTGGKTTNGNQPQMYTCGASDENWTWVQDGTIRFSGKCLQMAGTGSAADTPLELETCGSGNSEQQWRAGSDSEIVNPASGKCFYVGTNDPGNGYKPDAHVCANDLRHHFLRPAAPVTSGVPGKCMGLSGAAIEVVTCANVSTQHWVAESNGEFEAGNNSSCLKENGTTAGSTVSTGPCSATSTFDLWTVSATSSMPIGAELRNSASGLCVTVPSPSSASGTRVLMEPCAAAPGTPEGTWHIG
ncbi:MAG: ricin-type beta-trefoil lectin domain protein, partial [Trebonia sp.]